MLRLKLCELERYTSPDYCFMSSPGIFSFQISRLQSGLSHCPLGAGDLRELKPKASTRGRHSRCEYAYQLRQRVKLRSLEYCLRDMLASFSLIIKPSPDRHWSSDLGSLYVPRFYFEHGKDTEGDRSWFRMTLSKYC